MLISIFRILLSPICKTPAVDGIKIFDNNAWVICSQIAHFVYIYFKMCLVALLCYKLIAPNLDTV